MCLFNLFLIFYELKKEEEDIQQLSKFEMDLWGNASCMEFFVRKISVDLLQSIMHGGKEQYYSW